MVFWCCSHGTGDHFLDTNSESPFAKVDTRCPSQFQKSLHRASAFIAKLVTVSLYILVCLPMFICFCAHYHPRGVDVITTLRRKLKLRPAYDGFLDDESYVHVPMPARRAPTQHFASQDDNDDLLPVGASATSPPPSEVGSFFSVRDSDASAPPAQRHISSSNTKLVSGARNKRRLNEVEKSFWGSDSVASSDAVAPFSSSSRLVLRDTD